MSFWVSAFALFGQSCPPAFLRPQDDQSTRLRRAEISREISHSVRGFFQIETLSQSGGPQAAEGTAAFV